MLNIANILIPYDSSNFAKQALRSGLNLSKLTSANVHVVHIEVLHGAPLRETTIAPGKGEMLRKRVEKENAELMAHFRDIVLHYGVGTNISAAPAILRYAEQYDIDLIIIGTHGRSGVRRAIMGSVAEEIVRHAKCPVFTVRDNVQSGVKFDSIRSILVPMDFSRHSVDALAHAAAIAAVSGAKMELVHIVQTPGYATLTDAGLFSIYQSRPGLEERAGERLASIYAKLPEARGCAAGFHVIHGNPVHEIVQFAQKKEEPCDLIVMGTHGLTGLSHVLLGSTTAKTIRRASCPVFVVKSFGKQLIETAEPSHAEDVAVQ